MQLFLSAHCCDPGFDSASNRN